MLDFSTGSPEGWDDIAACLNSATSPDDVAAVPGKINAVEGELRTHGKPQFGPQSILLRCCSKLAKRFFKVCNHEHTPPGDYEGTDIDAVQEACNQLGWELADADRSGLEDSGSTIDVILDIGDFGWEPSLYVVGTSPLDVVDRCHRLINALGGMA